MNYIRLVLENPIYTLLFGSGGVLIIFLTVLALFNKKPKRDKDKNVSKNTDENNTSKPYKLEFDNPINKDNEEDYKRYNYKKEEFYLQFLKTLEEKKKKGDMIDYD